MGKKYTWYIEPLDGMTNESLSRELPETNFLRDALCSDKVRRNFWQCDWQTVSAFIKSSKAQKFQFRIFVKEGGGKIRLWNLYPKKK